MHCLCSELNTLTEPVQRVFVQIEPTVSTTKALTENEVVVQENGNLVQKLPRASTIVLSKGETEWRPLYRSDVDSIKSFLIFIGWPRSCHSIIGSMLDAHPNVIVAHEFFLFQQLSEDKQLSNRNILYNELYKNSYLSAMNGWRNSSNTQKGYSLYIDGSWQGRFTELKVIGDKCGGDSTRMYSQDSAQFKVLYQLLRANVKVPIKVLQVIRNPLDMIATLTLYRGSGIPEVKVNATVSHKYNNLTLLREATESTLEIANALFRMVPDVRLSPLQVYCEDLIAHPTETITNICHFLNLKCSSEFLQMCADKTFKNTSASRHLVEWNLDMLPPLIKKIKSFPFFHRYSFE